MNISAWAIRNPVTTILLFMVLTAVGIAGFTQLRVNNLPDTDLPLVSVVAAQPGAAPSELETQVARIIEDAVAGLEGVRHVNTTVSDGVSSTMIEFELGLDVERATNDVRNAVASVRSQLPGDIPEPQVQRIDFSGQNLITYVVRAPQMNPEELSWFVDNDVTKALLAVDGVAQVQRGGGVQREIRVQLNPDRLSAYGVTAAQVSQQLRGTNADLPGGRAIIGGEERSIRSLGAARTMEALRNTRITVPGGTTVKLEDLGLVENSWGEPRGRTRYNGEEVVTFGMLRTRTGSEIDVGDKSREVVAKLDASRDDVKIEEITSSVRFVEESYLASMEALLIGAGLAVAVVWLFLRDWRATFIAAVAMPLSLIPTFFVMAGFNQSFNIITLLALTLTIGLLVDDAIVEIENIVRHTRSGKAPYPAAIEASDEIGLAVVATTFTIVAVFAPVGFMGGIVGQFFKAFAIAACVSVLFSLLVARLLTPLMAAYLLKPHVAGREDKDPRWMQPYLRVLAWALDHRKTVAGLGVVVFFASLALIPLIPVEFQPVSDRSVSTASIELPPGATLDETDAVAQQVTRTLQARPEVKSVYSSVGSAGSGGDVRRGSVTANLVEPNQRALTQQQFEAELAGKLSSIPGARITFGQGQGQGGRISIVLVGEDGDALARASQAVEEQMRQIPGLTSVVNTANIARPEILVQPDPIKASQMGVTASTLSQAVRVATIGDVDQALPKYNLGDRQVPIRLLLTQKSRDDLSTLRNLRVPTNSGESVPLGAVATVSFGSGPSQIPRQDRNRIATIQASLSGIALGEANQRIRELPAMKNLPTGVRQAPAGDVESLNELLTSFGIALITGIVLMYIVLTVLFRSFAHPVTILTALPLAIGGAFVGLLIGGSSLSLPAFIGILMLMGIAAKNSILLVEYTIEAQKDGGMSRRDALMDAAHKRSRPILMTTVAMGAGMAPIALGIGADAEFRAPMAIAVLGGLLTSTLLSLVYVPVVFTLVDDVRRWSQRKLHRQFADQGAPAASGDGI